MPPVGARLNRRLHQTKSSVEGSAARLAKVLSEAGRPPEKDFPSPANMAPMIEQMKAAQAGAKAIAAEADASSTDKTEKES